VSVFRLYWQLHGGPEAPARLCRDRAHPSAPLSRSCSSIGITEFEADKRIVGIKNVTLNERHLAHRDGEAPVLPPTILTEAVAQVGAIMILSKPENRERLIYFMGIERVRYRRPVHPGDVVVIEAIVRRLRSRMGVLHGIARVDGKVAVEGTMTFALGPRNDGASA
jgi:3-hydroxyacyl-[acyl-carrier-protein] dehydratase